MIVARVNGLAPGNHIQKSAKTSPLGAFGTLDHLALPDGQSVSQDDGIN